MVRAGHTTVDCVDFTNATGTTLNVTVMLCHRSVVAQSAHHNMLPQSGLRNIASPQRACITSASYLYAAKRKRVQKRKVGVQAIAFYYILHAMELIKKVRVYKRGV